QYSDAGEYIQACNHIPAATQSNEVFMTETPIQEGTPAPNSLPAGPGSHFRHWHLSRDSENILYARLDRAGERVNSLSREVLEELEQLIELAEREAPRGLVFLSGKRT